MAHKYRSKLVFPFILDKKEVPMDVRNSKSQETRKVQERLVSTLEHLQVREWAGPGDRRSKRPLFACHIRCKCSMETLAIRLKVIFANKVQISHSHKLV